jgi:hypothetical protein
MVDGPALAGAGARVMLERLIEALKLVACSADAQIAALPEFVVIADEVALLFDEELRAVDLAACTPIVRERLASIDRSLSAMSETKSLWTIDALRTAPEWASLRSTAAEILSALGVTAGPADPH